MKRDSIYKRYGRLLGRAGTLLLSAMLLVGCTPGWLSTPGVGSLLPEATPSASLPPAPLPTPVQTAFPDPPLPLYTPTRGPTTVPAPPPRPPVGELFPPRSRQDTANINIAWGVETTNTLTIWDGVYRDNPRPTLTNAQPLIRWHGPYQLYSLAISPNHRYLAVLAQSVEAGAGLADKVLSVVDLTTNREQAVPSYEQAALYWEFYGVQFFSKVSWIDNNQFAVEGTGDGAVIVGRTGSSYSSLQPIQGKSPSTAALSEDGQTFFTVLGASDTWLNDAHGGSPRQIMSGPHRQIQLARWSPNETQICLLDRQLFPATRDHSPMEIWLLNVQTGAERLLAGENFWNVDPAWSRDGNTVAFLRADHPPNTNPYIDAPELGSTNIYTASAVLATVPVRLTTFPDARNGGLQWTPGGNLILSSTGNKASNIRNVMVVQATSSVVTTLINGSASEMLTHPYIFP